MYIMQVLVFNFGKNILLRVDNIYVERKPKIFVRKIPVLLDIIYYIIIYRNLDNLLLTLC